MSELAGVWGFTHIAGSTALAPATTSVSAAATASPVGWAAEAGRRKGAAATTSVRPRAAPRVRRDQPGIVWERVAGMVMGLSWGAGGTRGVVLVRIGPFAAVASTPRRTCTVSRGSGRDGRFAPFRRREPATARSPAVRFPVPLEVGPDGLGRDLPAGHRGD